MIENPKRTKRLTRRKRKSDEEVKGVRKPVSFLICGAQKAGTTALSDYIRKHPDLFIPERKELHYFDNDELSWNRNGIVRRWNESRYHRGFRQAPSHAVLGEATPIYMYWEEAPRRIWEYNPEMKIIVILRNPVDRAYSHWAMEKNRGNEVLSFEEAIEQEQERCREQLPLQHRIYSYVDRGFYSVQIRRLWHLFGKERVLTLRQEKLMDEPNDCLLQVWKHLGVERTRELGPLKSHLGTYEGMMPRQTHQRLTERFESEIEELESMLGWDCSSWKVT